jgi:hypothetical protein
MAEIELKLLKEKLDSLLDKGFITRVLLLGVDQLCLCQKKTGHNVCMLLPRTQCGNHLEQVPATSDR